MNIARVLRDVASAPTAPRLLIPCRAMLRDGISTPPLTTRVIGGQLPGAKRVTGLEPATFSLGRAGLSIVNGVMGAICETAGFALHKRLHMRSEIRQRGVRRGLPHGPRGWPHGRSAA